MERLIQAMIFDVVLMLLLVLILSRRIIDDVYCDVFPDDGNDVMIKPGSVSIQYCWWFLSCVIDSELTPVFSHWWLMTPLLTVGVDDDQYLMTPINVVVAPSDNSPDAKSWYWLTVFVLFICV